LFVASIIRRKTPVLTGERLVSGFGLSGAPLAKT
jgi:hypothetical protein